MLLSCLLKSLSNKSIKTGGNSKLVEKFGEARVIINNHSTPGCPKYFLDTGSSIREITAHNIDDILQALNRIQDLIQDSVEAEKLLQSRRQDIVNTIGAISWQADNNIQCIIQHISELVEATKHELYEEDERMAEPIDSAIPHF